MINVRWQLNKEDFMPEPRKPVNAENTIKTISKSRRMSTENAMLMLIKGRFEGADKLMNNNPLLTAFAVQDKLARDVGARFESEVPHLDRDREVAESIIGKLRAAPAAKQSFDLFSSQIEGPAKRSVEFSDQVNGIYDRYENFVDKKDDAFQDAVTQITAGQAEGKSVKYQTFMETIRSDNKTLKSIDQDITILVREGLGLEDQLLSLAKQAYKMLQPNEQRSVENPEESAALRRSNE
jgi:hypothetical protein